MSSPPHAPRTTPGGTTPTVRRTPRAAAAGRWGLLPTRWRLRRSPRWWQEILFIAISYILYGQVRNHVGGVKAASCGARASLTHVQRVGCDRALDIWHFERALGAGFELRLNRAVAKSEWLAIAANYWYAIAHFVVTVGVLIWIYKRHPLQYRGLRTVLYSTNIVALFGYTFYELAPPRMLTQIGFIDTVVRFGTWGSWGESGGVATVSNQFAAMPSMHVAWSTWVAISVVRLTRHRWIRVLGVLYPIITFFVIVATANHFWLDALGGLAALWLGFLIQRVLSGQPAVDVLLEQELMATTP